MHWPGFQSPRVSPLAIRAWHLLKACKTDGYLLTSDPRARPRNIFHVYTADLKGNQEHVRNFTSSQEVFTKYCSAVSTCTLALPLTTHMERGVKTSVERGEEKTTTKCQLQIYKFDAYRVLHLGELHPLCRVGLVIAHTKKLLVEEWWKVGQEEQRKRNKVSDKKSVRQETALTYLNTPALHTAIAK